MERWMNDPDREKPKYSDRNLFQGSFFHQRPQRNYLFLNLSLCSLTGMEPVASKFTDCANWFV